MLVEHLEKHLGKITKGWNSEEFKSRNSLQVAKFNDQPKKNISTYVTLGLSNIMLPTASNIVRCELLFSAYDSFDEKEIASFLLSFSEYLISQNRALLRGETIKGNTPIIESSNLNGVYAALPVFFEKSFYSLKTPNQPISFIWLIPLHSKESEYISKNGWNAFEDYLEKSPCDFWDLKRKVLTLK
jgi:hypothetical protein